jgi:methylated-DNA-protein-cysteine methyltransferase-like protein
MAKGMVFERVYKEVRKIPSGKVATYGQIANLIQNSNFKVQNDSSKSRITPRVVGFALHANRDPKVPCHRVVSKDGRIAKSYTFGGARWQKRKLQAEKVVFKSKMQVDLEVCQWEKWLNGSMD